MEQTEKMKVCCRCPPGTAAKPLSEFNSKGCWCKPCHREYTRQNYQLRKQLKPGYDSWLRAEQYKRKKQDKDWYEKKKEYGREYWRRKKLGGQP